MIDPQALSDKQLARALDTVIADLALAEKYEHNAHLRPTIRAHFDALNAERKRRAALSVESKGGPNG